MKITPLKNTAVFVSNQREFNELIDFISDSVLPIPVGNNPFIGFEKTGCVVPVDGSIGMGTHAYYESHDYTILSLGEYESKFTYRKLEDMQVGNVLTKKETGALFEVMDIYKNSFLYQSNGVEYVISFSHAREVGLMFKDQPQPETITIEGKTYDKEKALKALEGIENGQA